MKIQRLYQIKTKKMVFFIYEIFFLNSFNYKKLIYFLNLHFFKIEINQKINKIQNGEKNLE